MRTALNRTLRQLGGSIRRNRTIAATEWANLSTMLDGPFLGTEALQRGLLTRAQLYGSRYRRLFPGVYLPADHPVDLDVRSRAAYLLVRRRGVLGGYSAALLLGADCAPRGAHAEVLVGRRLQPHRGLTVRYGVPAAEDVVEHNSCRLTGPGRTA